MRSFEDPCVTAKLDGARAMVEDAIQLVLADRRERGEPIPQRTSSGAAGWHHALRSARVRQRASGSALTPTSRTRRFLDAYRRAFEAFDAPVIADLFVYPSHVTSDAGEVEVTAIPSREAWLAQIERLLGAYRAIGVRSAEARGVEVVELTPLLAQVRVHWALGDEAGDTIYEFDASYTLADVAGELRIAALAHNEAPRLRAALEHRRAGRDARARR